VGVFIIGESLNHCRALYWPFVEWWIQSKGADALKECDFTFLNALHILKCMQWVFIYVEFFDITKVEEIDLLVGK